MTSGFFWRLFRWSSFLTAVAILFVAFRGTASEPLRELVSAPRGLASLEASSASLEPFLQPAGQLGSAGQHCEPQHITELALDTRKPTKVFEFTLPPANHADASRVLYLQDPITETVVFTAVDSHGCRWMAASGRAFPFVQRAFINPFPNVLLPPGIPSGSTVQVLIQDVKAIRPWVHVSSADVFQPLSTTIWMGLAAFSTMLLAAAFIATGFTGMMKQTVVWSFVVYVVCFLFWLSQNFSMVSAGLGLWPEGPYFPVMQALAVASVVLGIGMASVEFLQLETVKRRAFQVGVAACALAFASSAWIGVGYKVGSALLGLVALSIAWALVRKLPKADLPLKLFALGLVATMAGGGVQAASVITGGGSTGYWPIFAFPLGAFTQGILWMLALVVRSEANRRAQEARLIQDATYDGLTGLYNRSNFTQQLEGHHEKIRLHPTSSAALLFLGIDRFKLINDNMGHLAGDEVLKQTATRLLAAVGKEGTVARFGGDEFLVLQHDCPNDADAIQLAKKILTSFQSDWLIGGRELRISASMGIVRFGADYPDVSDIIRSADTALHRAKDNGRNQFALFDVGMREEIEQIFKIESELGRAIELRQFELHYQPIVHLSDDSHAGFEALIRWRHPKHGMVNPAQFIEIAEESGHIRELGNLIVDMAMTTISKWKADGIWQPGWYVSINVSGGQLMDTSLLPYLDTLQQRLHVTETDIRLELTETAIISNLDVANQMFPVLRERGITLCMDDFGTGYSSLSYLSVLPFQIIKIDKSFVDGILLQPQQCALIKAMLSLATELNMKVVAEGIETSDQAAALREFGCDYGQGYHFSRPLPVQQATDWLTRHQSRLTDRAADL